MKLKILAPSLALLVLAFAARAEDYPFKEPFRHSAAFNPSGVLTLSGVNGSVTVRAWERNEILIEAEKAAKTEDELHKIELDVDVSSDRANVVARLPKRTGWFFGRNVRGRVTFTIHLPATARIERINVVNAGVDLEDMRGGVEIETVNGTIDAKDVSGNIRFETVNGAIHAACSAVTTADRLSFKTVNGAINVVLPPDAAVDLSAQVVNGSIDCDFPLTLTRSSGRKSLSGAIAGGGAPLHAQTVNGAIRIKRGGSEK